MSVAVHKYIVPAVLIIFELIIPAGGSDVVSPLGRVGGGSSGTVKLVSPDLGPFGVLDKEGRDTDNKDRQSFHHTIAARRVVKRDENHSYLVKGQTVGAMYTRFFRITSGYELAGKPPVTLEDQVAEIYESLREELFRYLLVLGTPPDLAQEACQEVFLRLYAALRKGQRIENRRAWVYTVARNCALSARVATAMLDNLDPVLEEQLASESATPERALLDREKFRRLHDAVSSLSPQQRHCLHLRVEGFRYREIAEIVGISISTVGEFLSRAVKRLRKALYD